jgi:hypothetical protein
VGERTPPIFERISGSSFAKIGGNISCVGIDIPVCFSLGNPIANMLALNLFPPQGHEIARHWEVRVELVGLHPLDHSTDSFQLLLSRMRAVLWLEGL